MRSVFMMAVLLGVAGCTKGEDDDIEVVDADADGVPEPEDCDDRDANIFPGNSELCDGVDNNCDGVVDEGVTLTFYTDSDGDGFGDAASAVESCDAEAGLVEDATDCDDADPLSYPGATERCDTADNDCDGSVDEDVESTFYADTDGDGYGDSTVTEAGCEPSDGFVEDASDCDDTRAATYPGAPERCNERDDDCDGAVDEEPTDGTTFYADTDGDGQGDPGAPLVACTQPDGYSESDTDCNDESIDAYTGAAERCDGLDNDCDGATDEEDAVDPVTWYGDGDGDGYGDDGITLVQCDSPGASFSDVGGDCDDDDTTVNPGADELCATDGVDDDCDGTADESDAADVSTWYADSDGDGFGGATTQTSCDQPSGYVSDATDCDDTSDATYPGADELCDAVDSDCDGDTDDSDSLDASTYWLDGDGDGYGDSTSTTTDCEAPLGYVEPGDEDCDDLDSLAGPATDWYADADADGYGDSDAAAVPSCSELSGYVENRDDCDDTEPELTPETIWYRDADDDGYGDADTTVTQCEDPSGADTYLRTDSTDCDDAEATTYPGADEYCDTVDSDCDGEADDADSVDAGIYWLDDDGDGYGDGTTTTTDCSTPTGYVVPGEVDCDDLDSLVGPTTDWYVDDDGDGYGDADATAVSSCTAPSGYAGNSDDCDDADPELSPETVWYRDYDGDGYGDADTSTTQCEDPSGTSVYLRSDASDCNDFAATTYPGAEEVCVSGCSAEASDNDCDGDIDEGCAQIHGGYVTSDETWAAADDHLVVCSVNVSSATGKPLLTVEAGTTVQFTAETALTVGTSTRSGNLDVQGTSSDPVVFASSASSPTESDWSGLTFGAGADGSSVSGLDLRHAGYSTAAIEASGATVAFTNVALSECASHGYVLKDDTTVAGDYTLEGGSIEGTNYGIRHDASVAGATLSVDGTTVSVDGSYALWLTSSDTATVTLTDVSLDVPESYAGIELRTSGVLDVTLDGVTVANADKYGLVTSETTTGTLDLAILDSTFTGNGVAGASVESSTLEVDGSTFDANGGFGLFADVESASITDSTFSNTSIANPVSWSSELLAQADGDGLRLIQPGATLTGNRLEGNERCGITGGLASLSSLSSSFAADNAVSGNGIGEYVCVVSGDILETDVTWVDPGIPYITRNLGVYDDGSGSLTWSGIELDVTGALYVGLGYERDTDGDGVLDTEIRRSGTLVIEDSTITADATALTVRANGSLTVTDSSFEAGTALTAAGLELVSGTVRGAYADIDGSVLAGTTRALTVDEHAFVSATNSSLSSEGSWAIFMWDGELDLSDCEIDAALGGGRLQGDVAVATTSIAYSGSGTSSDYGLYAVGSDTLLSLSDVDIAGFRYGLNANKVDAVTVSGLTVTGPNGLYLSGTGLSGSDITLVGSGAGYGLYDSDSVVDVKATSIDGFGYGVYVTGASSSFAIATSSTSAITNNASYGVYCSSSVTTSLDVSYAGNGKDTNC